MNPKKVIKKLFLLLGGDSVLRVINRTPRVLFWHGVDNVIDSNIEAESIGVDVFEKEIEYLRKHYEIISIEEFEKRWNTNTFTKKEIVLTFDDGYANNLHIVQPILKRYNLPFTVFISTEHIETGTYFPTTVARLIIKGSGLSKIKIPSQNLELDLTTPSLVEYASSKVSSLLKSLPLEQVKKVVNELIGNVSPTQWQQIRGKYQSVIPMTWEQVLELQSFGATIGSHCMYHICCHNNQSLEEVERHISLSKRVIEQKFNGEGCYYFAYPNGDFTSFSNDIVAQNYHLGFSTNSKERITINSNKSIIPRFSVPRNFDTFKILLNLYPRR